MTLLKSFLLQIAAGVLGFFVADHFLQEVTIETTEYLFYAGISLGVINFFIRPVLRIVTLPLRILTLGLFTFVINIFIVWFVKAIYQSVVIEGLTALIYTTLIIWALEFVTYEFSKSK